MKYLERFAFHAVVVVMAMAIGVAPALARQGMGMGHGRHGYGHARQAEPGGPWVDLSDEQMEKLQAARQSFLQDTEDLRQQLYEKQAEMFAVMAKKSPDPEKAKALQKDISRIKGELDLKHLEHVLEVKQIHPHLGRGFVKGLGGPGHGRGHGSGWGGPECGWAHGKRLPGAKCPRRP